MSERDKAIEEAREFCYRCPNPPENWDLRGTSESMADFALDYHAKQNADAEKWIPIQSADDLPKENGYYLATCGSVGIDPDDTTSHELNWFGGKWYLPSDEMIEMDGVIAWMEKPKPYTEPADNIGEEEGLVRALKERSRLDPDAPDAIVLTSDAASEY